MPWTCPKCGVRVGSGDSAVIEPLSLAVQTYATQLRTLITAIQTFDARIAAVFATHADHDIFGSFPGAGDVCAPRLAAAFGTDRSRWNSSAELQAHSGIAPVTERSGKTIWVHRDGRVRTTINSAAAETTITPRCVPWRTSGFGFCFAAGKSDAPTMKTLTSTRFVAGGHRS